MREVVVAAAQLAVSPPLTQTRKARRRRSLPPPTARPRRESRSGSPDVFFFSSPFLIFNFILLKLTGCFVYVFMFNIIISAEQRQSLVALGSS